MQLPATQALSLAAIFFAAGANSSAEPPVPTADEIKTAITKSMPLLWKGAEGHVAHRSCFACHNQTLPLLAVTTARSRGFSVRDEDVTKQLDFIAAFLDENRDSYRKGRGQGGQVDTAGYALLALELGGRKSDATTEAVVEYLLQYDRDRNHWRTASRRPPSEASDFAATYLAIRALKKWSTPQQQDRVNQRIAAARDWLLKTTAKDTEDLVFRLCSFRVTGVDDKILRSAIDELVAAQRPDGGWGQTAGMGSDAYATGSALVALHEAGNLATNDAVYRRGVDFLLKGQMEDGSWHVRTHAKPIQTYFESGFPHGKDQFISIAASGWATTALIITQPPVAKPIVPAQDR